MLNELKVLGALVVEPYLEALCRLKCVSRMMLWQFILQGRKGVGFVDPRPYKFSHQGKKAKDP